MLRLFSFGLFLGLAACSAPQGQKLAMTDDLAPVASGPPTQAATLLYENRGQTVTLYPNATVTVKLPAKNRDGYEWRLAEIPDPSVLELVSKDYAPSGDPATAGEQTLVFQAVGPGDVNVKMWYGTLWASPMDAARPYNFIAAVGAEPPPPAKKSKKRSRRS